MNSDERMTAEEKAKAYDELRRRADKMGFACIGHATDAAESRFLSQLFGRYRG